MSGLSGDSLKVAKTIKLFIGGEFPRTESGRSFPVMTAKKSGSEQKVYAHACLASRKDMRNAVTAALEAQKGWQGKTSYLRGQILYRMAEMTEGKREEFTAALVQTMGLTPAAAEKSVDEAIDAFVYYAGFSDKYQQLMGAVNPVSGPHHNFTTPEAVGVVALLGNSKFDLGEFVAELCAIIVSGNSVVALLGQNGSALLAPLAEVMATSDLPKGVVNLLTGSQEELAKQFGQHMEIQSLSCMSSDKKLIGEFREQSAANMKRVVVPKGKDVLSLQKITQYLEFKTVWHPVGQ